MNEPRFAGTGYLLDSRVMRERARKALADTGPSLKRTVDMLRQMESNMRKHVGSGKADDE